MEHVATSLRANQNRREVKCATGQGESGGVGAKGVTKEKNGRAKNGGDENRQRHESPVFNGRRAKALGCLAPFPAELVEGRRHDQDHEWKLEVEIGQSQT